MTTRINAWLEQLTLDEKVSLCAGADLWSTTAVERLGIPSLYMADGPHGIRMEQKDILLGGAAPATCFPTGSALGASWNKQLLEEIGTALGKECKALGVDLLLGPGINMKRSPLCGRNFEYYSEDPYLTGELGASFVKGVQSQHVGTTLKHYACNNTEFERMTISSEVDERTLREIYLAAFERIVKKAKPWAIMSAYNKVNGIYASENRYLLNDILRKEWHFDGIVMSDWLAVNDRVAGLEAGLDLEMPGPAAANAQSIMRAVRSGKLAEHVLDDTISHLLSVAEKVLERPSTVELGSFEVHHGLARKAAEESIVLLKNDRTLLPLDPNAAVAIAVIGVYAHNPLYQGGGSSKVNPTQLEIPFDEIRNIIGSQAMLPFAQGYLERDEAAEHLIEEAVRLARQSSVALLFVGIPQGEAEDREHLDLPANQIRLIQAVSEVQKNVVVIINGGSAVTMNEWVESAPAIVQAWLPGQAGGGAIANILFGIANPSGKLSETFPVKLSDNPSYLNFPGEGGRTLYGEGLFVGYRYYDKKGLEPLFPFGHGLSYTSFHYDNLSLNRTELKDTERLTVALDVTNTGSRLGMEVVQLYIHDQLCKWARPEKELKSFEKVMLEAGESKRVSFEIEQTDFCYYDPQLGEWTADTGAFTILIGSSSRDIRLSVEVVLEVTGKRELPKDENSSVREWLMTEQGVIYIQYAGKHFVKDANFKNDIANGTLNEFYLQMPLYKFIMLVGAEEEAAISLKKMFFPLRYLI